MRRLYIIIAINIFLVLFGGCKSKETSIKEFRSGDNLNHEVVLTDLTTSKYQFTTKFIGKSFYDAECYQFILEDNANLYLYVYVYESIEHANLDISYIGSNGYSYNNGNSGVEIDWVSYPHFYQKDNLLLLYIGENEEIMNVLTDLYEEVLFSRAGVQNNDTIVTLTNEDIIKDMESKNYQVTSENTDKDILEGERYWLTLDDNENIGVYVYGSADKASEDASYLNSEGDSYNSPSAKMKVDWVSYPHFYQKENIIILYVGENEEIINDLTELYGEMFAGMNEL